MHELLIEDYQHYIGQLHSMPFQTLQDKFKDHTNSNNITKQIGDYSPKLHYYEPELDLHKKEDSTMRKIPAFNGKKNYHNTDNLHRKVLEIFKNFIMSQIKDLREYLRLTIDVDLLSHLLSKIEVLRFKNSQFNLLYFLFTASKRSVRIYLKMREEIVKEYTFSPVQYMPISTHNSAKYRENYCFLDSVGLGRGSKQWEYLIHLAGFDYDDEFTSFVFQRREEVTAVELIEYCLWLNKQTAGQSPTKG